jgi:hypothetical protein
MAISPACGCAIQGFSRCAEKTCKSELDRFARKGADRGQADIISYREGEAALPSLLVPKALTHGIV